MGYRLGIDLGTTWTAAAVARDDGTVVMVSLGTRSVAVPTLVHVGADSAVTVGEAAARRGASEPDRLGREVKRRVGDTVPVLLGGSPFAPEALLAEVASWVVETVTGMEGAAPESVCVTHPANWGPLRRELLAGALRHAGLVDVVLVTEPEAAALHYAAAARVPVGTTLAVYDLGGGTFDATVLRKDADGFLVLGQPDGIDRLGGLDFDAAVLAHVTTNLGDAWAQIDEDDLAVRTGVARLRDACVAAKEALSSDTDAAVAVTLPELSTEVRITRGEFEQMVRPAILTSIEALRRAIDSAGIPVDAIDRILLVGGSSRVPLVGELLGGLGPPLALDSHPKDAVALGAARFALAAAAAATATAAAATSASASNGTIGLDSSPAATGAPSLPPAAGAWPRRPSWLVPLVVAVVVAVGALAYLGLTGAGDGGDDLATGGASTTSATTTPADEAASSAVAVSDLAGSYELSLLTTSCEADGAVCPEEGVTTLQVRCFDEANCIAEYPDEDLTAPLVDQGDGEFTAEGEGNVGFLLPCVTTTEIPRVEWRLEIRSVAVTETGAVDALDGRLTMDADPSCGITSIDYDFTGRIGEAGDEIAALSGTWTLVADHTDCTGDGCGSFPSIAMPLVVDCVGATCTAALDGGSPTALVTSDVITTTGLPREAFGQLDADRGFNCDGLAATTSFSLFLEPLLDGQGRLVAHLSLNTEESSACGFVSLQAETVGIPSGD